MKLSLRLLAFAALAVSLLLTSCATTQGGPFPDLDKQVAALNDKGTVAVVGIALEPSGNYSIGLEKAKLNGRANIAQAIQSNVESLIKSMEESISGNTTSGGAEVNTATEIVSKSVAKQTLVGVRQFNTPQQKRDGKGLMVGVIMGVDQKVVNKSVVAEVKTDPKLYERYRASNAYEDLEKEVAKLE